MTYSVHMNPGRFDFAKIKCNIKCLQKLSVTLNVCWSLILRIGDFLCFAGTFFQDLATILQPSTILKVLAKIIKDPCAGS